MEKLDQGIRRAYAWACERLYHEFAWSYDSVSRLVSAGQWQAWRAVAVPLVQGKDVLELGFGTGVLMQELTEQGHMVTGVDASTSMMRIAQRRLERHKLDAAFTQATGQALPFADQSFDTVVATFPAPYILEPATLAECARVLRKEHRSRLIIVGLWVALREARVRQFPLVFYAEPPAEFTPDVAARLARQGLIAEIEAVPVGWANIGIIRARHADVL
jgi:SAM-dependent methyltransferase